MELDEGKLAVPVVLPYPVVSPYWNDTLVAAPFAPAVAPSVADPPLTFDAVSALITGAPCASGPNTPPAVTSRTASARRKKEVIREGEAPETRHCACGVSHIFPEMRAKAIHPPLNRSYPGSPRSIALLQRPDPLH